MSVFTASSTDFQSATQSALQRERCLPTQAEVQSLNLPQSRSKQVSQGVAVEHRALNKEERVPVVDLAVVRSGDEPAARLAEEAIVAACREWGFFQVINHGVSLDFIGKFRRKALALFSLPPEQKDYASKRRGGSSLGYEFRPDHGPMEVFQVNASDSHQVLTYAQALFPDSIEDFIALLEEANTVFQTLAREILDILIRGLGADAKHFQAHKDESHGMIRANYYHQSKATDEVLGLVPHVDGCLFSILHQQDVCGLEVLKDGSWIPISPQDGGFCINVADIMQVLSNGQYKSVQHRAVVPKTQRRLSFVYFFTPARSISLVPAPELVDSQHPPLYRPFTWKEFLDVSLRPGRLYPSILPFFENKQLQS